MQSFIPVVAQNSSAAERRCFVLGRISESGVRHTVWSWSDIDDLVVGSAGRRRLHFLRDGPGYCPGSGHSSPHPRRLAAGRGGVSYDLQRAPVAGAPQASLDLFVVDAQCFQDRAHHLDAVSR